MLSHDSSYIMLQLHTITNSDLNIFMLNIHYCTLPCTCIPLRSMSRLCRPHVRRHILCCWVLRAQYCTMVLKTRWGGCFFLHNGQLSVKSMSCLWLMSWIFSVVSCESTWGEVWYNMNSLLHQRATTISWSMSQMFSQIHAFRDAALMIVQLVHVRSSETICWCRCDVHVYLLMYIRPVMSDAISRPDLKFMNMLHTMLHILSFWDAMRWVYATITTMANKESI